jgi:hypothetical protein
VVLSVQSSSPETTFAIIFAIVWLGAVVLTLNVLLLVSRRSPGLCSNESVTHSLIALGYARSTLQSAQGGRIIFFQSVAVIGYCLFPLDVRAQHMSPAPMA